MFSLGPLTADKMEQPLTYMHLHVTRLRGQAHKLPRLTFFSGIYPLTSWWNPLLMGKSFHFLARVNLHAKMWEIFLSLGEKLNQRGSASAAGGFSISPVGQSSSENFRNLASEWKTYCVIPILFDWHKTNDSQRKIKVTITCNIITCIGCGLSSHRLHSNKDSPNSAWVLVYAPHISDPLDPILPLRDMHQEGTVKEFPGSASCFVSKSEAE